MNNNEKNNDWVEVAATAAGILIPILIRTLGGQLEEIEVPCSLKSPARSLKTIFLRLPAGFFVFRVL